MTGYDCICQAVALFEDALASPDGPIRSVAELAGRTGYSVHHFSRIFQSVTGISPKDYMLGRILTEAARELAETDRPLVDIALACGFPDYESFSRAFRRRFGQPPKTVRLYRHPPGGGQSRLIPSRRGHEIPLDVLEPVSLTREAHHLTGPAFFADTGTPSFHALWARFMAVQNRVTGRTGDGDYRQFTSWGEDPRLDGLAVLCALETEPTVSQEPLFTNRPVSAARYLRFVHVGDIATIARTYQAIYGLWFAEHDIRPLPGWEFQCYRNKGAITDIYIPLELL